MVFILGIPFILHAVITTAAIIHEDCSGYPMDTAPSNETVLSLPCHHWPSIHRIANGISLTPGAVTKLILTSESITMFRKITMTQIFTTSLVEIDQHQLSQTASGNPDILDIAWDMISHCALKRKSKYVHIFSDPNSGINIKEYLRHSTDTPLEILFVNCRNQPAPRNLLNFPCVIVACNSKDTARILNRAVSQDLVTESHSWIILCKYTQAIQTLLDKKRYEVIDDLVFLSYEESVEVTISYRASSNRSTINVKPYSDPTAQAIRLSKPCREAKMVTWTHPLKTNQDTKIFKSYSPPRSLSGCSVKVLLIQTPSISSVHPVTGSFYGIDYEFLSLANKALGANVTYNVMDYQQSVRMRSNLEDDSTIIQFQDFDVLLPFFEINDDTFNLFSDYTMPFIESSVSAVLKTIPKSFNGENALKVFMLPFASGVWWSVLAVSFVTTITWILVRRYHASRRFSCILSAWDSLFDILSIMPGQGVWNVLPGLSSKIILTTISIFTLLNSNFYSAKIIAYLTDMHPIVPFTAIHEFVDRTDYGFASEYEEPYINTSELYKLIQNSNASLFRGMTHKRFTSTSLGNDFSDLPNTIGKNLYITYRQIADYLSTVHTPHLVQPFKGLAITPKQMPIRKGFSHKRLYSNIFKRLHEAGIYNKISSETMYRLKNIDYRRHVDVSVSAIEITAVSMLFEVLLIGIFASLIALAIEMRPNVVTTR